MARVYVCQLALRVFVSGLSRMACEGDTRAPPTRSNVRVEARGDDVDGALMTLDMSVDDEGTRSLDQAQESSSRSLT